MPAFATQPQVYTIGTWTSEKCDNSLGQFPSGTDTSWGLLTWEEENSDSTNYVRVDILKDSDNSVLISDQERNAITGGIDLSTYSEISSDEDIKIRFKLYVLTNTPIVRNIRLGFKTAW